MTGHVPNAEAFAIVVSACKSLMFVDLLYGDWYVVFFMHIYIFISRKKRGHKPTGILVHAVKAIGLSSASEMIKVKGPDNLGIVKNVKTVVSPKKPVTSSKVCMVV